MSKGPVVAGVVVGVVALLVGGAFIADRVVASTVETRAAEAIQQNLDGVVGTPKVDIGRFPFLTQVLKGTLDDVSGHVDGVTIEGIPATDVTLDATDVSTTEPYVAGTATISATLPTASIDKIVADRTTLDVATSVDGDTLKATGKVLGLTLSAALVPRVRDGKLLVDVQQIMIGGVSVDVSSLPSSIGNKLDDIEIPIEDGLPEGLVLSDAQVVDAGVRITATGTDVTVPTEAP
ncbi:DUF2993 domain-containing protein [Cellulomonas sp. URHE0023]|uniref:LmeA family phospholipid-binding protein n=1 Tax=Cellulomonas sp. URHE0023 TaxID=1380354 RepID=UPI00048715D4|nr:DUF2993 domain-containing protein [Cellulomonas sp. URHE0023]